LSTWSRRDLLRVTAGAAAVAVPMGALSRHAAAAPTSANAVEGANGAVDGLAGTFADGFAMSRNEPVMFCVHDAKLGEVSILHGTDEVVVKDPQLVRRILHAASRQSL
jgi:hypothetical protein